MEVEKINRLCDLLNIDKVDRKKIRIDQSILILFLLVLFVGLFVLVGYIG